MDKTELHTLYSHSLGLSGHLSVCLFVRLSVCISICLWCIECKLSYNLEKQDWSTKTRIFDRNIDLLQAKKDWEWEKEKRQRKRERDGEEEEKEGLAIRKRLIERDSSPNFHSQPIYLFVYFGISFRENYDNLRFSWFWIHRGPLWLLSGSLGAPWKPNFPYQ